MIITRLVGGLGNQMFQYAAGRRLAYILNTDLKLDISWFENSSERKYSLGIFNIQERIAAHDELKSLTGVDCGVLRKLIRKLTKTGPIHFHEKHFHFHPELLTLSDEVYLQGYWQSEKYFVDIEHIIRREFSIKYPQTGINKLLADKIADCNSVSLHIRRGDYVSEPMVNQVHGVCQIDYYEYCIKQLTQDVKNPHFFIFSDEPDWVRQNIELPYPITIVDHNNPSKSYEDLRLMSQCKYHIIANSSFSWWGAWLDAREDKIVFSPKNWFKNDKLDAKDLVPDSWMKL